MITELEKNIETLRIQGKREVFIKTKQQMLSQLREEREILVHELEQATEATGPNNDRFRLVLDY